MGSQRYWWTHKHWIKHANSDFISTPVDGRILSGARTLANIYLYIRWRHTDNFDIRAVLTPAKFMTTWKGPVAQLLSFFQNLLQNVFPFVNRDSEWIHIPMVTLNDIVVLRQCLKTWSTLYEHMYVNYIFKHYDKIDIHGLVPESNNPVSNDWSYCSLALSHWYQVRCTKLMV